MLYVPGDPSLSSSSRAKSLRGQSSDLLFASVARTVAACLLLVIVGDLPAATTTVWELNGYQDFLRGRLSGLSITRDGRLVVVGQPEAPHVHGPRHG